MGIRSEVGIALKSNIADAIVAKHPWVRDDADRVIDNEEGQLFVFDDIKWYVGYDAEIDALYADLYESGEDYIIIEACSHTEVVGTNHSWGEWNDNPWTLSRVVNAFLHFDE